MKISLKEAKKEKLFYLVTNGIVYNSRFKKCLILKRSSKEVAHPELWGVVGGKLEWSDLKNNSPTRQNFDIPNWEGLLEKQLKREAFEEAGVKVIDPRYLKSIVYVRPDSIPVVLVKFGVRYKSGRVKIGHDFEDWAWVDEQEVKQYNCIKGIPEEVAATIGIYR